MESVWLTDYWLRAGQHYFPSEDLIRFLGRRFNLELTDKYILELGSGTGNNTWAFGKLGCKSIVSVDISEIALDKTERMLGRMEPDYRGGWQGHTMDIRRLPWHWENDTFDAVVDVHCTQHIGYRDHPTVYEEICGVLKAGGYFFSVHLNSDTYDWQMGCGVQTEPSTLSNVTEDGIYPNCGVTCFPSEHTMVEWLADAGFAEWQIDRLDRNRNGKKASWHLVEAKK
jgi:SAM-dependent methyltransferase